MPPISLCQNGSEPGRKAPVLPACASPVTDPSSFDRLNVVDTNIAPEICTLALWVCISESFASQDQSGKSLFLETCMSKSANPLQSLAGMQSNLEAFRASTRAEHTVYVLGMPMPACVRLKDRRCVLFKHRSLVSHGNISRCSLEVQNQAR